MIDLRPARRTVLVWHDRGQSPDDARRDVDTLDADVIAARWDPAASDRGRRDLLTSVRDARAILTSARADPDDLDLIGFGVGGVAAASLASHAKRLGIAFGATVCVDPRWNEPDPISGNLLSGQDVPDGVELVEDRDDLAAVLATRWRPR